MGAPFLFLDEAELMPDGARGTYLITGREEALRGHFKHGPVFPASLLLEALGQLGVFYLLQHPEAETAAGGPVAPASILFTACDGVRCTRVCGPGDRLELRVKVGRLKAPLALFAGQIVLAGTAERVARAEEFVLSFGP